MVLTRAGARRLETQQYNALQGIQNLAYLSAYATPVAAKAYSYLRDYFTMPPVSRGRYSVPYGRRMVRRKRRSRKRTVKRKLKRQKKRFVAGPGTYQYKQGRRALRRTLNTNFQRNNFDSCRDWVLPKLVQSPASDDDVQIEYSFKIGDIDIARTKMFDYSEYRITNIQLVITPMKFGLGAETLTMAEGEPYMYIIPRHDTGITPKYKLEDIKRSPGVWRINLMKKTRTVINLTDFLPVIKDYVNTDQTNIQVPKDYQRVRWIENPQEEGPYDNRRHPQFGRVILWLPQILAGYQPRFTFQFVATVLFRGYKKYIIDA